MLEEFPAPKRKFWDQSGCRRHYEDQPGKRHYNGPIRGSDAFCAWLSSFVTCAGKSVMVDKLSLNATGEGEMGPDKPTKGMSYC